MPLLLGLLPENLVAKEGVRVSPHPQGVNLAFTERKLVREYWQTYYPHWRLNFSNPPLALLQLMQKYNLTLALAESCTGGGIASRLTDFAGASRVLAGGVVVYTPLAKSRLLGLADLPPGCVAASLTQRMAAKIRSALGADLGLGITGALGPQSPAEHIQVGEIYIGVHGLGQNLVRKFKFSGDRQTIKGVAIEAAFNILMAYVARWYIA